jgi:hypothetical protein
MNPFFSSLFDRLREPSTWAGLGVIASIVGVPTSTYQLVQQVLMGVAGLVAVAVPESKA